MYRVLPQADLPYLSTFAVRWRRAGRGYRNDSGTYETAYGEKRTARKGGDHMPLKMSFSRVKHDCAVMEGKAMRITSPIKHPLYKFVTSYEEQ